jgi:hypothetical protein
MNFKLKETPEQIALVEAIGSRNLQASMEAQEALAAWLGPVIQKVLMTKGTVSSIFSNVEFDEDDSPSYPLDLYYGEQDGYVTVWSQNMAGGLPTNQIEGVKEMKIATYRLDSAVSFNKRYARKHRLDVVSKAVERLLNEVLIKQEKNGWAVILKALAEASTTPKGGAALKHVIAAGTANSFNLADLNNLMVREVRLNESYSGNTPDGVYSNGPTDLYVSPEIKAQIRAFAFNPVDTSAANTAQNLPEGLKMEVWKNAGMQGIFGVNINQLVELGIGKKYNVLFHSFTAGNSVPGSSGGSWAGAGTDEILVGIDNSRGAFVRPVARQADSGGTFRVMPDDQFNLSRVDKAGFWGFLEEGRVCLDARAVAGIVV